MFGPGGESGPGPIRKSRGRRRLNTQSAVGRRSSLLAELIGRASRVSQIWVTTHSRLLTDQIAAPQMNTPTKTRNDTLQRDRLFEMSRMLPTLRR
jgi:hypothetical protein